MWSLKCYFGVYCPCCFATQKRHTKIRMGIYHSPASQCKWKFGRVSGKQAWASGILYRLYKKLPSLGECRKFLVSQPENNILACVMTQNSLPLQYIHYPLWTCYLMKPGRSYQQHRNFIISLTQFLQKSCLFFLLWRTTYVARPHHSAVALYTNSNTVELIPENVPIFFKGMAHLPLFL